LNAVDAAVPELIQGLYLTGSVALDDFQDHGSDIDFVAVSARRPDDAGARGLASAHALVRGKYPDLNFDGTHLTWSDLAAGPLACAPAPFNYEGKFEPSGRFALDPVTWHELVGHSVALRGPALAGAQVWHDVAALRLWTLHNLTEYWRPWLAQYRDGGVAANGRHDLVAWGVLGVARIHHTVTTGQIASKTQAGRYALEVFGSRWHQVILEAIRIRQNPTASSSYGDLSQRGVEVAEFMELVIHTCRHAD
jgi:hypothetical protein